MGLHGKMILKVILKFSDVLQTSTELSRQNGNKPAISRSASRAYSYSAPRDASGTVAVSDINISVCCAFGFLWALLDKRVYLTCTTQ